MRRGRRGAYFFLFFFLLVCSALSPFLPPSVSCQCGHGVGSKFRKRALENSHNNRESVSSQIDRPVAPPLPPTHPKKKSSWNEDLMPRLQTPSSKNWTLFFACGFGKSRRGCEIWSCVAALPSCRQQNRARDNEEGRKEEERRGEERPFLPIPPPPPPPPPPPATRTELVEEGGSSERPQTLLATCEFSDIATAIIFFCGELPVALPTFRLFFV